MYCDLSFGPLLMRREAFDRLSDLLPVPFKWDFKMKQIVYFQLMNTDHISTWNFKKLKNSQSFPWRCNFGILSRFFATESFRVKIVLNWSDSLVHFLYWGVEENENLKKRMFWFVSRHFRPHFFFKNNAVVFHFHWILSHSWENWFSRTWDYLLNSKIII